MKINRTVKILVGIATAFSVTMPFAIAPFTMLFLFTIMGVSIFNAENLVNQELFTGVLFVLFFYVFFSLSMCSGFFGLALKVFYIIHVVTNDRLEDMFKALFAVGMFFLSMIAMPVYYILYVWNEAEAGSEQ